MLAHDDERPSRAALLYLAHAGAPPGVSLAVDEADEMLGHLLRAHHGSIDCALVGYFQTGLMAADQLARLVEWLPEDEPRVLDFASGFGRVTRFVAAAAGGARLTVSDIDPAAVAFQQRHLGVRGRLSAADPAGLDGFGSYELVFVASLLSHLPAARFDAWLAWLLARRAPGGALAFSVHGAETLPAGRSLDASGYYFEPVSETRRLAGDEYGSTWVDERFVAAALDRAGGGELGWRRFPRALWHSQDLYVVAEPALLERPDLELDPPPQGHLDHCHPVSARRLRIGGWALGAAGGRQPVEVRVSLGGEPLATAVPAGPRPDAAAELGPAAARAGWSLEVETPRRLAPDDLVAVTAHSAGHRPYAIFAGSLEVANLYLGVAGARRRGERLRDRGERQAAELGGLRRALADEGRRVAELDAAVHRLGWERHVLAERLAAVERSRAWRLRRFLRRLTGRRV